MTEPRTNTDLKLHLDTDKQNQIRNLYTISHYPIHIFHADVLIFSPEDASADIYRAEKPFLCDPNLIRRLRGQAARNGTGAGPSIIREDDCIYYGILGCPTDVTVVVGPLSELKLSVRQTHAYMRRHGMTDFQNYSIRTGAMAQAGAVMQLLDFIMTGQSGGAPVAAPRLFNFDRLPQDSQNQQDFLLQSYKLSHNDEETDHVPYRMEEMMMSCIREGDYEKLKKMFTTAGNNYSSGTMAHSPLKQTEYGAVIGVSLMSRAAIAGGVNPYDAYDMNDLYLQKIAAGTSEKEYNKILTDSFLGYINAVRRVKAQQSQSLHIEKCKSYISRHLNKPFTRDDLARYTGLNPAYLSHLFVVHEGQTLKSYILKERVHAAGNMLTYSDYSISQISAYLCFGSQSRFGATFKKFMGMSPAEYRRQNKHMGF